MAVLLYDPDCGLCTRLATLLQRVKLGAEVSPLTTDAIATHGIDAGRAQAEIPFVGDDGAIYYGSAAIGAALLSGRAAWRTVGALLLTPPISCLAQAVYRLVSRNRHRLPGRSCGLNH